MALVRLGTVILGVAFVVISSAGCTTRGCGPEFTWTVGLPGRWSDDDLRTLTLRVCHNGVCDDTPFSGLPAGSDAIVLGGGGLVTLRESGTDTVVLSVRANGHPVADGDRWSAVVTDASGAVVVGLSERAVDYDELENNAPWDHCYVTVFEGHDFDARVTDGGP